MASNLTRNLDVWLCFVYYLVQWAKLPFNQRLALPSCRFPLDFAIKTLYALITLPLTYAISPAYLIFLQRHER
jgi:hypothetical protein